MAHLIDGFNLIYKFPDLEELMYQRRLSEARKGLLEKLREYVKITGARLQVVFDGKKEKSLGITSENFGAIDVFYSQDYSADFLIKQFVKKDVNPRMTTVVTSDKDIIFFVNRFKAKVKTSEEFAEHLNETVQKWREARIPEKEEDPEVTEDEVAFWERMFRSRPKQRS